MALPTNTDFQMAQGLSVPFVTHRNFRKPVADVSQSEKLKIVQYLENPVSYGLWRMNAEWLSMNGISQDIWTEIEKEIKDKEAIVIKSGKRERRIKVSPDWRENLQGEVCSKISFLFALFDYLSKLETQQSQEDDQFGADHEATQLVLDLIDISPVKIKYAEALTFFQNKIWFPGFKPITTLNSPSRSKSGIFILQNGPNHRESVTAIAWEGAPLEDLKQFWALLGKAYNTTVMPIFSPEEEVFAPYFDLLSMAQEQIVPQSHLRPLINKAISNFNDKNFIDCVSTLGLSGEDILTQIYETLYREQLTKGLTLGQLADELHNRASIKFKKKEEISPDLSSLFPVLKTAIEDPTLSAARSVELLRNVLALSIEVNKHTQAKIEKIGKVERKLSIWPESVNHSVTELIRYRNAASHKSRIPIGPMECRRAAYAFVVLIRWWLHERTMIDWSKTPDEILRSCVDKYSK
jgi:hypothetical protein